MKHISEMSLDELTRPEGHDCECGRHHSVGLRFVRIGENAVDDLPEGLQAIRCRKPFVVCDNNTRDAAWERVRNVLERAGVKYKYFCFETKEKLEPDEYPAGALCMEFDPECDCVLGIGSGVINDCCKVLAHTARLPQIIVGTAPSMDGFASDSSAMVRDRIKVTVYNACPQVIIADTAIMKNAPERMLQAGFGDMIAKYVALCEWRISSIVTGEYYCDEVAGLMRRSLRMIREKAPGLIKRDPESVKAVVEGLILSGIAMSYAKVSRPASGLEHYFSHIWEMLALERGEASDLHGIQVGVGTAICMKLYDRIKQLHPDAATTAYRPFSDEEWQNKMRSVFGKTGQNLIDFEHGSWHLNDQKVRAEHGKRIVENWDAIQKIISEELPEEKQLFADMRSLRMPMWPKDLGIDEKDTVNAFVTSRNIRNKYLTSTLLWDLGILDDFPLELHE